MARERIGSFSSRGAGNAGIQVSAGMDVGKSAATSVPLDVCARVAVSGQAIVKLILAVFGIAVLLIVVWVILWMLAMREKN